MSRWKASGLHLLISFIVIGLIASYIVYFWYPPALMHMAKADRLLMLIGGVDLVVGPLLTLIVYKANKPRLKLDLTIIALMQIIFLGYGLQTIWNSRPVFLVAVPDRFEFVFANEITPKRLAEAKIERFKKLSFSKPALVGAVMPVNTKEQDAIFESALSGKGDLQTMPKYYVEYEKVVGALLKHGKPLVADKATSKALSNKLIHAAKAYDENPSELVYFTLASSRHFAILLVNKNTGVIVGPVNADPE
ncbi:MAG: hypothetical protein ACREPB_15745 [Arenimonas sp.]